MQTLLNDIELDIQELKCLMQAIAGDTNSALRVVAKRSIQQMKMRLDELQKLLDEIPEINPIVTRVIRDEEEQSVASAAEPMLSPVASSSPILAECIKPSKDLRHAISLNDSFRFTRELFGGDALRMNEIVRLLGEAPDLNKAIVIFNSEVQLDEENEAVIDFIELLKKYFC
ncbi:hypothetical protein [Bacteroides sp.]|uniref:hypothetical protein n=1 Tax=Bacteroides sp. TaxID=29523 RepID=UPI002609BE2D|nr:hypothetical protein [Bacteroides sp.]